MVEQPIAHIRASDKSIQTLSNHLRDVSTLSGAFANKIGNSKAGELVGLLHDLGKFSNAFQNYLKSAQGLIDQDADDYVNAAKLKGKIDHSTSGAQFIWNELQSNGKFGFFSAQLLALLIASHHSGLIDCISGNASDFGEDAFSRRMKKSNEKTFLDEVLSQADTAILNDARKLLKDPGLLKSIEARSTEIYTSYRDNPELIQFHFGLLARFLFSCLIDADRIDTADFENPYAARFRQTGKYESWGVLISRLESHISEFQTANRVDELRTNISQNCLDAASRGKGIYTLTVPTGGGKTLASLRFALHHAEKRQLDRIFYVVPFTSIIDQNAEVARSILETGLTDKGNIVLEHHSNLTPEQESWREKTLSVNWDAPVVYTTMVQFLESLFAAGTRGARRMHQLANSVIIFDEIQSLPIECVHLFNNAVNFLSEQCNSTVILCTATQPLLHKVAPELGAMRLSENHEIIPDPPKLFQELKRVEIVDRRKTAGWSYTEIAKLAVDETKRDGSCLVIVNTKDAAKKVFQSLPKVEETLRFHLSTDMCPAHRKNELEKIRTALKSGTPVICVSTQLIEAGVDVDFGAVIRFLAGLDSIAQAAGRCNRNGLRQTGIVSVVNPEEERLGSLKGIQTGIDKVLRVLDDFRKTPDRYNGDLLSPQALNDFYSYYFFDRRDEMAYRVSSKDPDILADDTLVNLLSKNEKACNDYQRKYQSNPKPHFKQAFMTAAKAFKVIDAPTQGILVPYGEQGKALIGQLCKAFEPEKQFDLLKRSQQYTVNVFPHVLDKLKEAEAVRQIQKDVEILYLDSRYYSDEFGLSTGPVRLMEDLNV